MSSEDDFRRMLTELRLLESTGNALQDRINMMKAAITELAFASSTIEGLEKEKKGTPLLVPIGGGSYIKAEVATTQTMVVGIGAGVSVEKTRSEARQIMEKRSADLEKSRASLEQQLGQVLARMRENRQRLDAISTQLVGSGQPDDVRKIKSRS
ncbi:MAG: prefoldin subunit alpha [Candidatus Bathyarchaeota archaeon]|nr:prefoldin subunit alpha [Candidatus Bathyarchaeota archaeon]